ncbi:MAG: trigger factor [Pseudomonadota bacterium]
MKCTVEEISSVKKKMHVEVPHTMVAEEVDNAYKELGKKIRIKGFRQGRIPRNILERYYRQKVEMDVLEKLLNESYPKALEEAKLSPVSRPVVSDEEFKPGSDLKYTALVEVKPFIQVKDYLGLEIEREEGEVTDEDIGKKLDEIRYMHAHLKSIDGDRGIEKGDIAVIDYDGSSEGNSLEGSNAQNYHLEVGSGLFNPDFEKQLIGLSKNAETEIKVTFSEEFANKEMAGKTVTFKVAVKDIKERVLPEMDNAFAADLGAGFQTLDELRQKIKENLIESRAKQTLADMRKQILDQLAAKHQFELPESMVEAEIDAMIKEAQGRLEKRGIALESVGISNQDMRARFGAEAEKRVRSELILEEIARNENIKVEEKDIDEQFDKVARDLNMEPDDISNLRANPGFRHSLPGYILPEKTISFLLSHANIKNAQSEAETAPSVPGEAVEQS